MLLLVPMGVIAGVLTTVAGMGGGMMLVLALSAFRDAHLALAATSPALLFGNAQRVMLFRGAIDREKAIAFSMGAVPGALIASFISTQLPEWVLAWLLVAVAALAVARGVGFIRWTPSPRMLAPAGAVTGVMAGTSGAGIFVSPILLAAGLKGDAFIATAGTVAVAIHVARIIGYGAGGMLNVETMQYSALLFVGIVIGNILGKRLRYWLGEDRSQTVTYVALVALVVLAVAGVVG